MSSSDKEKASLKDLRQERQLVVERVAAHVKELNRIRKMVTDSLKDGPKTVPAVAEATGIPSRTVFWHLIAMRKYGKVAEAGQEDDYPTYRLIEELDRGNN